ncbi:TPA: Flp family type IVb pilin [Vibrio harveyi]|uniref:Flp family type IVb pilin n=1 Tax=Vibrio harveyi TaxID=669 RepID=UPI00237F58B3|nr:Flp family type IVb pilin [Vibrio harveyi]HDM8072180.1 Flp family type IVb pilin [Vibrio harveyi]
MIIKLCTKATLFFSDFRNDQRGVTAIEYGLIGVAMAVLLSVALGDGGFISSLEAAYAKISTTVTTATK